MYHEEKMYGIICDNCKESYQDDHNGWSYMIDENSIWELADNDGWHEEGEKHYCPKCHHFDDDDNLVITTLKPTK